MYLAGIVVLQKIKNEFADIALCMNIRQKELEDIADKHLVKHYEGLAYISAKQGDYTLTSAYLQEALSTKFSFKVYLKWLFFNFWKILQRLKPFSK